MTSNAAIQLGHENHSTAVSTTWAVTEKGTGLLKLCQQIQHKVCSCMCQHLLLTVENPWVGLEGTLRGYLVHKSPFLSLIKLNILLLPSHQLFQAPGYARLCNLYHRKAGCSSVLVKAWLLVLLMKDHSLLYPAEEPFPTCSCSKQLRWSHGFRVLTENSQADSSDLPCRWLSVEEKNTCKDWIWEQGVGAGWEGLWCMPVTWPKSHPFVKSSLSLVQPFYWFPKISVDEKFSMDRNFEWKASDTFKGCLYFTSEYFQLLGLGS